MVNDKAIIAAIGNFDGVHRGHAALIKRTSDFAREKGAIAGAVVFDPHPRRYFRPGDPPFLITAPEDRDRLLAEAGAEVVQSVKFDAQLAKLSPEEFVRDVLKGRLSLAGVVASADFRFGADRAGDAARLKALAEKFALAPLVLPPVAERAIPTRSAQRPFARRCFPAPSDRARNAGPRVERQGRCGRGQQGGANARFPTANLTLGELIEPRRGVYAVKANPEGRHLTASPISAARPSARPRHCSKRICSTSPATFTAKRSKSFS
ncbi:MAG: riboflavin kinase [Parvularculaceae bacterium]